MPASLTLFYDADTGETVFGKFIDDGKTAVVLDQDIIDLMRWDSESPNVEANPYENLREVSDGTKIWLKSGRVLRRTRKRKNNLGSYRVQLVEDDGFKQRFRFGSGNGLDQPRKIT